MCIIEIEYTLVHSICGFRFLKMLDEIYAYTEYFPKCSKYWVPCSLYEV